MDDIAKSAFSDRTDLHVRAEGEFWAGAPFAATPSRPFWQRMEDDGSILCACLDGVCRLLPVRLRRPLIREGRSLSFLRGMLNSPKGPVQFLSPIKPVKLKVPPAGA